MAIERDVARFVAGLPGRGSLLAVDVSKRRLGLAGTDLERRLVTPLLTISRGRWPDDAAKLGKVIAERTVAGLVVGWPLNMDGSEGPACESVLSVARLIEAAFALPVLLMDERLTSFAVEDAVSEGLLPRPKRGQPLDHYAAAVILEDALRVMRAAV